ncbi:hypothetical protein QUF72_11300, partial [Desulfobacterales bacterium HSG2]|nr:hypothetical protein [Desulfobacterales bacterium HSG2]
RLPKAAPEQRKYLSTVKKSSESLAPGTSEKDRLKAFTPEALAALPPELLRELENASVQGDSDRIGCLIEDIRSYNAALADALAALAADFECGKIFKSVKEVRVSLG